MIISAILIGIMYLLFSEAARTQKVARCEAVVIPNAILRCTTKDLAHTTYCGIYCKKNYEYEEGPKALICQRGLWYIEDGQTRYTVPTTCSRVFAGDSRSLDIVTEQHDGMCSNKYCSRRYYGIPERRCESYNCCWNSKKKDCYEPLEPECQIAMAKRTTCPSTWYGIPRQKCENKGCCFDGETSTCYKSNRDVSDLKTLEKDLSTPKQVSACGDLEHSLINGRLNCDEANGILTCTAACFNRYVLEGVSIRSCHIRSKEWSPGTWRCRLESCNKIPKLIKTFVDCTNGERLGSICSASCARGYTLLSYRNSATCLPSGEWSVPTLWQCTELQCPVLQVSELVVEGARSFDGTQANIVCTNRRKFGSVCAVNCPLGYVSNEATNIRCGLNGQWTSGVFRCQPLQCQPLLLPLNIKQTCTAGYDVGSVCDFLCHEGFELIGESSVSCRPNQKWSGSTVLTSCEVPRKCEEPVIPAMAKLQCSDGSKVGTLCSLTCPPGELLEGYDRQYISCLDDLHWDVSFAGKSCKGPPKCGKLKEVFPADDWEKLNTVCSGENHLGSVCSIDCGIHADGVAVTTCTRSDEGELQWDKFPPRCINLATQACNLEIDLSEGTVSGDEDYEKYVDVTVTPNLPIWGLFRGFGAKYCDYQSVIRINYQNLTAFALKLVYEIPSSFHFELSNSDGNENGATSMRGDSFNIKGQPALAARRVFPFKDRIMFILDKSRRGVTYQSGSTEKRTISADFHSSPSLYFGMNRAVHIQHAYDIGRMGTGLCKLCFSYAQLIDS